MNPDHIHISTNSRWWEKIDKARQEKKRVDRLNSLRRGSMKPLPKWAESKQTP